MGKKQACAFIFLCFISFIYAADLPLDGYRYGAKRQDFKQAMKDISNPESWEETKFELLEKRSVLGSLSSRTELVFWNERLYTVNLSLPPEDWGKLEQALNARYGAPSSMDTVSKMGIWMKDKETVSMYVSLDRIVLGFSDESQKEFHFGDLFHGVLLYIILSIVGLFVLNWLFAWLITDYCKRCKSFSMKMTAVEHDNLKDYSTSVLGRDLHYDKTYVHQCSKCGHIRRDRYRGFWDYMRSKD